ncbi:Hypothetical predicted protein [Octopus vulgaris]|uniref:Uncharacterized protein n=1 Tax=Octopus vulgaris TaxID=6645 RepID=A0AA36B056_OCTVU|nr:Hypothetical predicted protein [Octopus vulgaris]
MHHICHNKIANNSENMGKSENLKSNVNPTDEECIKGNNSLFALIFSVSYLTADDKQVEILLRKVYKLNKGIGVQYAHATKYTNKYSMRVLDLAGEALADLEKTEASIFKLYDHAIRNMKMEVSKRVKHISLKSYTILQDNKILVKIYIEKRYIYDCGTSVTNVICIVGDHEKDDNSLASVVVVVGGDGGGVVVVVAAAVRGGDVGGDIWSVVLINNSVECRILKTYSQRDYDVVVVSAIELFFTV